MDQSYIQGLITTTKSTLDDAMSAQQAIIAGTMESYKMDTGQGVVWVTKLNIGTLQRIIDQLFARLQQLENMLGNNGSVRVVPSW